MKFVKKGAGRRAAFKLLRVIVTLGVGVTLMLLMAGMVLPFVGALLVMNAGLTADMSMITAIIMVIVPEFACGAMVTAFVCWVTHGVWKLIGCHAPQIEEE